MLQKELAREKEAKQEIKETPVMFVKNRYNEMVAERMAALEKMINRPLEWNYGENGRTIQYLPSFYDSILKWRSMVREDWESPAVKYDSIRFVEEYMEATSTKRREELLKTIKENSRLSEWANVLTYKLKDDFLISGAVYGRDNDGKLVLRAVENIEGVCILITPQIAYRWPGEQSSARKVLSPKNGFYKVAAIWSSRNSESDAYDLFDEYDKANIDSLRNYSLNGYLLLKDEDGLIGWVNRDSCAYFSPTDSFPKGTEEFYRQGFAWMLHGLWQENEYRERDVYSRIHGSRKIYDFVNFIRYSVRGKWIYDESAYEERVEGYKIYGSRGDLTFENDTCDGIDCIKVKEGISENHYYIIDGFIYYRGFEGMKTVENVTIW